MRIRTIKPEFWTSPTVAALSYPARLLFVGLWNYADDEGRGLSDPRRLRLALFPFDEAVDDAAVRSWMLELRSAGLVVCYRAVPEAARRAVDLYAVRAWGEHQRIDRPTASRYPAPKTHGRRAARTHGRLVESSASARSGRERKGKEVEGKGGERGGEPDPPFDPNQLGLFETPADDPPDPPAPAENGNGSRRPWSEKPNPWENLDDVVDEIGREP